MRDLLRDLDRLAGTGPVGRGVVVEVRGSAPRPAGSVLLANPGGAFAGSLAGGCVEGAAVEEIAAAIARGTPRLVSYGLDDPSGWNVGLACGGSIRVLFEPAVRPALVETARAPRGGVLATVVGGPGAIGAALVVRADEAVPGDDGPWPPPGAAGDDAATALAALRSAAGAVRAAALEAHALGESRIVRVSGLDVFLEVLAPAPRLVVYGASEVAAALVRLAKVVGYTTVVADARPAFLVPERFPDADEILRGWPEEVLRRIGLDAHTYLVILTHDPKLDEPALRVALASPARYVGLIGSRSTQAARRERLRAAGVSEDDLARIHGPVGLDLRGRSAAEVALAILAEITAVRRGGTGRPLGSSARAERG